MESSYLLRVLWLHPLLVNMNKLIGLYFNLLIRIITDFVYLKMVLAETYYASKGLIRQHFVTQSRDTARRMKYKEKSCDKMNKRKERKCRIFVKFIVLNSERRKQAWREKIQMLNKLQGTRTRTHTYTFENLSQMHVSFDAHTHAQPAASVCVFVVSPCHHLLWNGDKKRQKISY